MNKEELEKEAEEKFKVNNKDKGREHYYDRMWFKAGYLAGAEPREKRIAELEKENEQLKSIAEFQQSSNMKRHFEIQKLEKENAELKGSLELYENGCCRAENKCAIKDQLAQAKEIIKELLLLPYANNEEVYADVTSTLDEAEQFLKEIEKCNM